ncbi:flavin reductase family protein [Saccharothrix hoggarensis]|uniref:Flavin reductase family protein n=1 Tax=Saccharothrix hoggarensis TaxID=913853 RepID=A0ABW3QMT6_9PSEU
MSAHTTPMPSRAAGSAVAPDVLRRVMSRFATGVVVLTVGGEHIRGMTANAFTSVSLSPPLVLCCVAHSAVMHGALTATGAFGVSVMGADQEHVARHFADKRRPDGRAQFESFGWHSGPRTGAPLIGGALAWLECEVSAVHTAGDHSVIVGTVLSGDTAGDGSGLLFYGGAFRRLAPFDALEAG